jgi:hypothetical protein
MRIPYIDSGWGFQSQFFYGFKFCMAGFTDTLVNNSEEKKMAKLYTNNNQLIKNENNRMWHKT